MPLGPAARRRASGRDSHVRNLDIPIMHFPLRELCIDPAFRKRMLRSAALILALLVPMGGFMGWHGFNQVTDC